jgi:hypothetical protein
LVIPVVAAAAAAVSTFATTTRTDEIPVISVADVTVLRPPHLEPHTARLEVRDTRSGEVLHTLEVDYRAADSWTVVVPEIAMRFEQAPGRFRAYNINQVEFVGISPEDLAKASQGFLALPEDEQRRVLAQLREDGVIVPVDDELIHDVAAEVPFVPHEAYLIAGRSAGQHSTTIVCTAMTPIAFCEGDGQVTLSGLIDASGAVTAATTRPAGRQTASGQGDGPTSAVILEWKRR